MTVSNINNNQFNNISSTNKKITTTDVALRIQGKEVMISKKRLNKVAKGLAKFAYLTGETNDEKKYSKNLENDLFEALILLNEKRKNESKITY
jgi:hypothetical protein